MWCLYFVLITLHFILAPIGECFVKNQCFLMNTNLLNCTVYSKMSLIGTFTVMNVFILTM